MSSHSPPPQVQSVEVLNPDAASQIVLVCEHASATIPAEFDNLGLSGPALHSHIAWDPGAQGVAHHMADRLDATLVAGCVSRLVYDCNRPPHSPGAMVTHSGQIAIPGNADLTPAQRQDRVTRIYAPFRAALANAVSLIDDPVIVTIHSFTPIFMGQVRDTEIGILHDTDARLAEAMLDGAKARTHLRVRRNEPYSAADGVTHTLREHALPFEHRNVMIELRSDLIATPAEQSEMADLLCGWVLDGVARTKGVACTL